MAQLSSLFRIPAARLTAGSFSSQLPLTRQPLVFARQISQSTRPKYQYHLPRNGPAARQYSTVVVQDRPRGRTRRIATTVILSLGSFAIGGYFALSYAPPFLTQLVLGTLPSDADTLKYEGPDAFAREVDEHIKNCKLAQMLRTNADFIEARPHLKMPPEVRDHNLTGGTLMGTEMITVPPLCFNQKDGKAFVCIFYVGKDLSGHPGIVHGGFLATMLDEGLARCAFPVLPNKVGVTGQLSITYRRPTKAGQYLALIATTTKAEGRKAWSEGVIVPLDEVEVSETGDYKTGQPLVQAEGLFIEPRHARILKNLYRQST